MTNAIVHLLARKTTHPNTRRTYCGIVVYGGNRYASAPSYIYKGGRRAPVVQKGAPTCLRCKNAMPERFVK